jgi:hypothetical protein
MSAWTSDLPNRVGWYWLYVIDGREDPTIVLVEEGPEGDLWLDAGTTALDELDKEDWLWAGPIEPPTMPGD